MRSDFKGKQSNAIVGHAPGGGTNAVARSLGHYMVMIAGQPSGRALKSHMSCEIAYTSNGGDATSVNC